MDIIKWAKDNWKDLAKVGGAAAKYYIDSKDQQRRMDIEEGAYNKYMQDVANAGQEAQAAIDVNLTPMTVSNVPTSKADVTDFTAVAARGGLMNLPNRQRKRYASQGFVEEEDDIEIIEPEFLGDFELRQEEGVPIGPMAEIPKDLTAEDAVRIFKLSNGRDPIDMDEVIEWFKNRKLSQGEVQGDTKMAKGNFSLDEYPEKPFNNPPYKPTQGEQDAAIQHLMTGASGGIAGLRHGGRPGYAFGPGPVMDQETMAQSITLPDGGEEVVTDSMTEIEGQMASDKYDPNDPMYKGINKKIVIEFIQEGIPLGYSSPQEYFEDFYGDIHMKKGGRIRKDNGGIMNLGGMEKDYRTTGGFVPIGGKEKADDVPARLSKNEFVMTADAVRAAGGGSINKGAQRMYDTMKHLEARPQNKRMIA